MARERKRARHAGMRKSGERGREVGTPIVHDLITNGKGKAWVVAASPLRQAQSRRFGKLRANSGDANPGALKRVCRDTTVGSRAEVEVDKCSLFAADVSSFRVDVSSCHPNVSTFRAHVSSLRPNVSSWGSRRLRPGSPSAEVSGRFEAETRRGSQPAGGRRWLWRRATTREQGVFTVFAAMCSVFARMCSLSGPMCSVSAPFPPRCVHFPGRCVQSGLTTPPHRRPQRGGSWAVLA